MRTYWLAFLLSCGMLINGNVMAEIKEYELKGHPTLTFEDPSKSYEIKLKGVKCTHRSYSDEKDVTISYIVKVNNSLSKTSCDIYISLQDDDGFEITSRRLSSVVGDYTGNLKGNFEISTIQYQKISGSELFLKVK